MLEKRERRSRYVRPPNISGWVLVAGLAGFVAAIYLFTRNGCDNEVAGLFRMRLVKIDTWEEWREHLAGTDLYAKYKAWNVDYVYDSIRADFIRNIPLQILASRREIPAPENLTIWNEGPALHIASISSDDEAIRWKIFFEQLGRRDWSALPKEEYFIYASIATLFEKAVVHGPGDREESIKFSSFLHR